MSTPLNADAVQPEPSEEKRKNSRSPFRALLLVAAIYSLIIHHVQKHGVAGTPAKQEQTITIQKPMDNIDETSGSTPGVYNAAFILPLRKDAMYTKDGIAKQR